MLTTITRGYKYRIYPTKEQSVLIAKTIGCCRLIWNVMLADKIDYYNQNKVTLKVSPAQYKSQYTFLKEVDATALCNVWRHLESAYQKFFNEPNIGFPKFKSKKRSRQSYTTSFINDNIRLSDSKHIRLPKLGDVKIKLHRPLPDGYVIKNVTISQEADGTYYASICVSYEVEEPTLHELAYALGLDYSSPLLYVDSDGNSPNIDKWTRKYAKKLAWEQRKLSRCVPGSKNYEKQRLRVAKVYAKIRRCRLDALHKLSHFLVENYDLIGIEDLDMRAMSQTLNLGKSTMDNGFGMLRSILIYKMADRGKYLITVGKFFASTKTCHDCGAVNKSITLDDRQWVCQECGAVHDRDKNAAKNIRDEAVRLWLGRNYPERLFMLG